MGPTDPIIMMFSTRSIVSLIASIPIIFIIFIEYKNIYNTCNKNV